MPPSHLRHVLLASSVYHACFVHALSTEREEVMGLLMGQTTTDGDAHVWHSVIIPRLDKRPDRVEISSERLAAAPDDALKMTNDLGMHTRVLGWYHSHPHITPYPSHVDLRTQATYQTMDPVWVGLIFSVFDSSNKRGQHTGRVALHCFQSIVFNGGESCQHRRVPVTVVPDEYLLVPGRRPQSSALSLINPALTILCEAKEMRNNIEVEEQALVQRSNNNNGTNNNASTSSSSSLCQCSFDAALFDEACRNVIESQTFAVCQKLLKPVVAGDASLSVLQLQRDEMRRNEEMISNLKEEIRSMKEAAALRVLS